MAFDIPDKKGIQISGDIVEKILMGWDTDRIVNELSQQKDMPLSKQELKTMALILRPEAGKFYRPMRRRALFGALVGLGFLTTGAVISAVFFMVAVHGETLVYYGIGLAGLILFLFGCNYLIHGLTRWAKLRKPKA